MSVDLPQLLLDHYLIFNPAGPEPAWHRKGVTLPGKAKPPFLITTDNGAKAHYARQDDYGTLGGFFR